MLSFSRRVQNPTVSPSSVSDPYSLNPDPDPAKNINQDPGKFFSPTKIRLKLKREKNVVHKTIKKN